MTPITSLSLGPPVPVVELLGAFCDSLGSVHKLYTQYPVTSPASCIAVESMPDGGFKWTAMVVALPSKPPLSQHLPRPDLRAGLKLIRTTRNELFTDVKRLAFVQEWFELGHLSQPFTQCTTQDLRRHIDFVAGELAQERWTMSVAGSKLEEIITELDRPSSGDRVWSPVVFQMGGKWHKNGENWELVQNWLKWCQLSFTIREQFQSFRRFRDPISAAQYRRREKRGNVVLSGQEKNLDAFRDRLKGLRLPASEVALEAMGISLPRSKKRHKKVRG